MAAENTEEKKVFNRAKLKEAIILVAMALVSMLLTVIFYSVKFNGGSENADGGLPTLWNVKIIHGKLFGLHGASVCFMVAFFVLLALMVVAAVISFVKRNRVTYYVFVLCSFGVDVALLVLHFIFGMLRTSAVVLVLVDILVLAATFALLLVFDRRNKDVNSEDAADGSDDEASTVSPKTAKTCRIVMLVSQCVAAVAMLSTLLVPIYTHTSGDVVETLCLFQSFKRPYLPIYFHVAFLLMFIGCIAGLLVFVSSLACYKKRGYYQKSKSFVYGVVFLTLAFFVAGYVLMFILKLLKKDSAIGSDLQASTFIPFAVALAALLAHSIATGKVAVGDDEGKVVKSRLKVEPLIYVFLMTAGLFASLLLNVVVVKGEINSQTFQSIKLSGYKLLTDYPDLASGFQLMSFLLFAILLTSAVLLIISTFSLIAKNKDYYTIVKTTAFTDLGFALLVGLMGVYFKVAQKINEENVKSLLTKYGLNNFVDFTYKLSSQSIYVLLICGVVFAIMLFRRQFNLAVEKTEYEMTIKNPNEQLGEAAAASAETQATDGQPLPQASAADFDACPAFTELDAKLPQLEAELAAKRQRLFDNFTLPTLVRFVVDYARDCRLHLSYSVEDIATFVAGLGASRLTILQGMSGTGKTSLPKIFTEAIMGVCEIVEVESSWRDKNELLGYYNEFSKCFTPKKFTQCLYKARLNSSVLTLIVLDELNLSRIEYYFSDFLSLMEHEPDKREIKLLNVKLFRTEDGKQISYKGLTGGHTIKIPQNVWFVGTANRDESTFAISDKVYDRAQTMNFNKRAPKIHSFGDPLEQRFASYDMFIKLFEEAKSGMTFDAEENATVQKVEKILAPYNISFGNRILKQMEDFVKIYCACFGDKDAVLKEAVEKILLSKVVSKLENKVVENKDALAAEFERLGLLACSDFVRKLNED